MSEFKIQSSIVLHWNITYFGASSIAGGVLGAKNVLHERALNM